MSDIRVLPRKESRYKELTDKIQKVDIAAIGHYTEFGFMKPEIKAVNPKIGKIFGPAVTVRVPAQESKAVHLAVSMVEEGDVVVIDRCGDHTHACVGEMVALCANTRKASAIIVDGPVTDLGEISSIGIPVFATGISGLTTKFIKDEGEINYDISCGGVVVHPGDLIMADQNGVLVLREFEAEKLISTALLDQEEEARDRQQVMTGRTLKELYCE